MTRKEVPNKRTPSEDVRTKKTDATPDNVKELDALLGRLSRMETHDHTYREMRDRVDARHRDKIRTGDPGVVKKDPPTVGAE